MYVQTMKDVEFSIMSVDCTNDSQLIWLSFTYLFVNLPTGRVIDVVNLEYKYIYDILLQIHKEILSIFNKIL